MIPVYAISVVIGSLAVLVWIFLGLTSSSVAGKQSLDPEAKFGSTGRGVVAGVLGFGLGGMSASFAGWQTGLAIIGAVGGAVLMVLLGRYLGVEDDSAEEPT